jgi:serine protease
MSIGLDSPLNWSIQGDQEVEAASSLPPITREPRLKTPRPHHPRTHPAIRARWALLWSCGLLATATALVAGQPAHARPAAPSAPDDSHQEDGNAASTDRLIVKYRDGNSASHRQAIASARQSTIAALQSLGLRATALRKTAQGAQVFQLSTEVAEGQLREMAKQLMQSNPQILYAEPDNRMQAFAAPTDPMYAQQWHYFEPVGGLNLPTAWDLSTGSGVVVAVIDTGVRPHADLAANLLDGYDFISDTTMAHDGDGRDADAQDPGDGCTSGASSWHGTHVAGTIAAVANNGLGVAGVAWNAKILPVRVLGCGGGYNSDIADGMVWAAGSSVGGISPPSQPAKVLNLSLGGQSPCSSTLQYAINAARAKGAVVVVAAGNSNLAASKFSPANCKGVITVAATGRAGGKAPYSNFGPEVDVAAPGGNMSTGAANGILSTRNNGGVSPGSDSYDFLQGTSMATPHVAGVAALMLARNSSLTPDEIEVLLKSNTRRFPGTCVGCGTGIVDATASVKAVFVAAQEASGINELEPNDSHAQAQAITSFPSKINGTISGINDLDTYRVSLAKGSTLVARLISNAESDYNLAFRGVKGAVISASTRGQGLTDKLSLTNNGNASMDVYVRVSRASGGVGDTAGRYTLELTR